jgi:hypothetical protein
MRRYGPIEFIYAEPVADALVADPTFRKWVLGQTKFAKYADGATKLMHEDMFAKRTDSAELVAVAFQSSVSMFWMLWWQRN